MVYFVKGNDDILTKESKRRYTSLRLYKSSTPFFRKCYFSVLPLLESITSRPVCSEMLYSTQHHRNFWSGNNNDLTSVIFPEVYQMISADFISNNIYMLPHIRWIAFCSYSAATSFS